MEGDNLTDECGVAAALPSRRSSGRVLPEKPLPKNLIDLFHTSSSARKRQLPKNFEILNDEPAIFLVRGLLTDKEIDHIDSIVTQNETKFKSSVIEDEFNRRRLSEHRTSKYIWFTKGQDQVVRKIESRLAQLVGLSPTSIEPLQVVSYSNGQYFDVHHDAGVLFDDGTVEKNVPKRLLTIFVYLNTLPEGQGHTSFPTLGVSVRPQRGCGVLFCNILPDGEVDTRTVHRAEPVEKGLLKYGVNIWFTDADLQAYSLEKPTLLASSKKRSADQSSSALRRAEAATTKRVCARNEQPVFCDPVHSTNSALYEIKSALTDILATVVARAGQEIAEVVEKTGDEEIYRT